MHTCKHYICQTCASVTYINDCIAYSHDNRMNKKNQRKRAKYRVKLFEILLLQHIYAKTDSSVHPQRPSPIKFMGVLKGTIPPMHSKAAIGLC